MVQPIPRGFHTVTPYLVVEDAGRLMDFIVTAFGGEIVSAHKRPPDGRVAHAEVTIGDSRVMLGTAPPGTAPMTTALYLYVPDCDGLYHRAMGAGATSIAEPKDQLYGDRHGGITDPLGNIWWIATHIEDVSEQEIDRRMSMSANHS